MNTENSTITAIDQQSVVSKLCAEIRQDYLACFPADGTLRIPDSDIMEALTTESFKNDQALMNHLHSLQEKFDLAETYGTPADDEPVLDITETGWAMAAFLTQFVFFSQMVAPHLTDDQHREAHDMLMAYGISPSDADLCIKLLRDLQELEG